MNSLNSILIDGNLVKDPTVRSTPNGTQVCMMKLASNRYYRLDSGYEKEVSYFDVETWARLAGICSSKGRKGRGMRIIGRLKQNRWNDNEGRSHSRIIIVADHVEFHTEFSKDNKPFSEAPDDDDYLGRDILARAGREMEAAVF